MVLCHGTFVIKFRKPDPISFSRFLSKLKKNIKGLKIQEGHGEAFIADNRTIPVRAIKTKKLDLIYISDLNQISIETLYYKTVIPLMSKILDAIDKSRLEPHSNKYLYFETFPKCSYKGKKSPIDVIKNRLDNNLVKSMSDIYDKKMQTFSIRMSTPYRPKEGKSIKNITPWFDFRIFPRIVEPGEYAIDLVYRTKDIKDYKSFLSSVMSKMSNSIDELEKEG